MMAVILSIEMSRESQWNDRFGKVTAKRVNSEHRPSALQSDYNIRLKPSFEPNNNVSDIC